MPEVSQNDLIYNELCKYIPGGVNSPVRSFSKMNCPPIIAERGEKAYLFDSNKKKYIDYCCSWGALIHGHAHPSILHKVKANMELGTSFGLSTEIELKLAKKVIELTEFVEQIRFVSSGTEATMSAIRLARAVTEKNIIIKFDGNYHGHSDQLLVAAGSGVLTKGKLISVAATPGVAKSAINDTISINYNDIEALNLALADPRLQDNIAAIIVEPIAGNMGVVVPSVDFIQHLRKVTQKVHALLIFDEVITGFRIGLKGAVGHFKVEPDLVCYGKIVGGGFPAAAFGGKKEFMQNLSPVGSVYQAGTLSGNPIAMTAGLESLKLTSEAGFYANLQAKTDLLLNPIKQYIAKNNLKIAIQSIGSMFTIFFGVKNVNNLTDLSALDVDTYAKFFRFLLANGVYIPPSPYEAFFISSQHSTADLEQTSALILQFIAAEI